ncbi:MULTISPECIES: hypothetical protein [Burkholderia cepacia complex]|uniref:hypothetical protein n=1 Tax=Burkholderia cepacia complex TaxID=87882 RepID=UPI001F2FBCAF|nr:hypothetical protein [Burkholderia cenocepacia]
MGIRKTERNDQHYAFLLLLCVCHSAITLAFRPRVARRSGRANPACGTEQESVVNR